MNKTIIVMGILCLLLPVSYISALAVWPLSLTVKFNSGTGTVYFTGSDIVNSARSLKITDAHGNVIYEDSETHSFPFTIIIPNGTQVRKAELGIQYDRFVPCFQMAEVSISQ